MEIQLPKNINSEEAVLNCINKLSSIIDDEIFITYSEKIKLLISRTGDLKLQIYFMSKYDELMSKRGNKEKKDLADKPHSTLETGNENGKSITDKKDKSLFGNSSVTQQEDIEELKNKILDLMQENNRLLDFEQTTTHTIKEYEKEISDYKVKKLDLEKQNNELNKKNNLLKDDLQKLLKKTNSHVLPTKNNQTTTIELQKITIANLNKELNRFKHLKPIESNLINLIQKIKLGTEEENSQTLEQVINSENLRIKLIEANKTISNLKASRNPIIVAGPKQAELNLKDKEIQDLRSEIEKLEKDNKEYTQSLKIKIRNLEKERDDNKELHQPTERLTLKLKEVERERNGLKEKIEKLEKEKDGFKKRLENCQKELRKHGLVPERGVPPSSAKSSTLENPNDVSYKGGIAEDGSAGFGNERRENGRIGSLSSFDNYSDDFNETHPNEYY